jgi:CRP/FNR family transcriptional regulator, cyclic AMP receptor protein
MTLTECEIMRIGKNAIVCTLHDEPAFFEMLLVHLLQRAVRVEADLTLKWNVLALL